MIKEVMVDGRLCPVTISDEKQALQAAYAAGGAIVGIWGPDTSGFDLCLYLVTDPEAVTERLLERAARRRLNLPWHIAETKRLLIREFTPSDPLEPESEYDGDGVFSNWEKREAYRRSQYRFAECGLWALVDKHRDVIVGKAGITDGELGYHIYPEYRGLGYAKEACRAILAYGAEELGLETLSLKVKKENAASLALAEKLGFSHQEERDGQVIFTIGLKP